MLEVKDPAGNRTVAGEVPAMTAAEAAAAYAAATGFGIRFCTRIKTAAVRFTW